MIIQNILMAILQMHNRNITINNYVTSNNPSFDIILL